ncbi:MAG TPA: glycosyltransferase family 2 protein [Bacteroidales bacterium]|nr:glycosyltransferase family 2 protein [Bacteroidales bacterium]
MIKTAVVILNWNGKEMLEKFIRDVYKKTISAENAVYLVDNGSTDNSLEWIRANLPDIGTFSFEENLGFAGGYSRALEMIEAEYYVLLNTDIEVTENWIDPVISYMDNNPEVAACQPKILSYSDRGSFEYAGAAGGFIDKYGFPFCRGRLHSVVEKDKGQYDDIRDIFWASGACMFIRSSVWHETGGLDPDFFVHMEEIDLCWRIHKRGYRISYIPDSVIYHVGGGTLPYESPAKLFYNFRNNLFVLHKNLPGRNYRKIILQRMTMDGLGALRYLMMFRFRSFYQIFSAHIAYYRNIKSLEIKRRAIVSGSNHNPDNLILNKSMTIAFFLKGQKIFTELWPENN